MWTDEKALAIVLVELLAEDVANNTQYFQESAEHKLHYVVSGQELRAAMEWLDRLVRDGHLTSGG